MKYVQLLSFAFLLFLASCSNDTDDILDPVDVTTEEDQEDDDSSDEGGEDDTDEEITRVLINGQVHLDALENYSNQNIPNYIDEDNTGGNVISDIEATIGRVLFYDRNLSSDLSVSCASCHQQAFAFGDPAIQSQGVNGLTARHSMRLANARFSEERRFFWDERANSLEQQTTMPIKDHGEMGFSGTNGDPDFDQLLERLSGIDYYQILFSEAYGDTDVTEERMQDALAQFIRSMQSFDSKYDIGRAMVNNNNQNFPNFTNEENRGKQLFMQAPQFQGQSGERIGGGLGCNGCHSAPEFGIDDNSRNNGVIGTIGTTGLDLDVTRAPSLRDIFNPDGSINSPMMHTGEFETMEEVIAHYNEVRRMPGNNNLDRRLDRGGGINLNVTDEELEAVVAFMRTLTGNNIYTDTKWSNPF